MDTDFTPIIENQIKIVAKIQSIVLLDLSEKNSEMLEAHSNLLFDFLDMVIIEYEDDDGEDDEPVVKPDPVPEDSKKY